MWAAMLRERADLLGGACFAERFVEDREFNVSILTGPDGPQILPPAEILFEDFAPGAPACWAMRRNEIPNPMPTITPPGDSPKRGRMKACSVNWRIRPFGAGSSFRSLFQRERPGALRAYRGPYPGPASGGVKLFQDQRPIPCRSGSQGPTRRCRDLNRISLPELIDAVETLSASCIAGRYWNMHREKTG